MLNQNLEQDPAAASTANKASDGADNVRVTTEEFIAAINRIDTRRAQESAHVNGTVAIGQTLRDLHVDANSNEVLREIEEMRRESVVEPQIVKPQAANQQQVVEALTAKQEKRAKQRHLWVRIWAAVAIFTLGGFAGYGIDEANSPDIAGLHSLSMMQNGQELFVTTDSVEKLIAGAGGPTVLGSTLGESRAGGSYNWPILMKNGQLCVLAYADPAESVSQIGTMHLHTYSSDGGPSKSQSIVSVPLAGTAIVSTDEEDSDSPEITIQRPTAAGATQQAK